MEQREGGGVIDPFCNCEALSMSDGRLTAEEGGYDWYANKIARSDGWVLATGLGALGVGRMWIEADTDDPRLAGLPYVPGITGPFENLRGVDETTSDD